MPKKNRKPVRKPKPVTLIASLGRPRVRKLGQGRYEFTYPFAFTTK